MTTLSELRQKFSFTNPVSGKLVFEENDDGLIKLLVSNQYADAEIYLQGAHITHFQPVNGQPLLWLSESSLFTKGIPIRGGVPVCWPWFGAHPEETSFPAHGFARISIWSLVQVVECEDGSTQVVISLEDSISSRSLWPFEFKLTLVITIGHCLHMSLTTKNTGSCTFSYSEALHSYLPVDDIRAVTIDGLRNTTYADKLRDMALFSDSELVKFNTEIDRIYQDTETDCLLVDNSSGRHIQVVKSGSQSTVVWNPWIDKANAMKDFGDDDWQKMVCIETANVQHHLKTLKAGAEHTMMVTIL